MNQKLRDLNDIVKKNRGWSQNEKQVFYEIMEEINDMGLDNLDNFIEEIINLPRVEPVKFIFEKMSSEIQLKFVEKFLEVNDKDLDNYSYISKLCKLYQLTTTKGYLEQNSEIFIKIIQVIGQSQKKDFQTVNQLNKFFNSNIDAILIGLKENKDNISNLDDTYEYMLDLCLNKKQVSTLNKLKIYHYLLENGYVLEENHKNNILNLVNSMSQAEMKNHAALVLEIQKVIDKKSKEIVFQQDEPTEKQSQIDENNLENPINILDKLSKDILLLKSIYSKSYEELEQYRKLFQEQENELKIYQEKVESLKKVVTSKEQQINKLLLNEDDYKSKIDYLNREKSNLLEKSESLLNQLEKLNLMGEADIKSAEEQLKNKIGFKLSRGYEKFNIIKTRDVNESNYKILIKIFERHYSDLKELGINLGE